MAFTIKTVEKKVKIKIEEHSCEECGKRLYSLEDEERVIN